MVIKNDSKEFLGQRIFKEKVNILHYGKVSMLQYRVKIQQIIENRLLPSPIIAQLFWCGQGNSTSWGHLELHILLSYYAAIYEAIFLKCFSALRCKRPESSKCTIFVVVVVDDELSQYKDVCNDCHKYSLRRSSLAVQLLCSSLQ